MKKFYCIAIIFVLIWSFTHATQTGQLHNEASKVTQTVTTEGSQIDDGWGYDVKHIIL